MAYIPYPGSPQTQYPYYPYSPPAPYFPLPIPVPYYGGGWHGGHQQNGFVEHDGHGHQPTPSSPQHRSFE